MVGTYKEEKATVTLLVSAAVASNCTRVVDAAWRETTEIQKRREVLQAEFPEHLASGFDLYMPMCVVFIQMVCLRPR